MASYLHNVSLLFVSSMHANTIKYDRESSTDYREKEEKFKASLVGHIHKVCYTELNHCQSAQSQQCVPSQLNKQYVKLVRKRTRKRGPRKKMGFEENPLKSHFRLPLLSLQLCIDLFGTTIKIRQFNLSLAFLIFCVRQIQL